MTDELKKLFEDLRARTLSEIVAPGAPQARATGKTTFGPSGPPGPPDSFSPSAGSFPIESLPGSDGQSNWPS